MHVPSLVALDGKNIEFRTSIDDPGFVHGTIGCIRCKLHIGLRDTVNPLPPVALGGGGGGEG